MTNHIYSNNNKIKWKAHIKFIFIETLNFKIKKKFNVADICCISHNQLFFQK